MARWRFTVNLIDENQAITSKSFYGEFADYATANAKADALFADIEAASTAATTTTELTEITVVGDSPSAGANVFERASATIQLNDLKKVNFKLPSPISALFTGNALKIDDTVWTNLMANFATGEWELSDGDHYVSTLKGARVFSSSGSSNIPV